jgi:hypothetical protein
MMGPKHAEEEEILTYGMKWLNDCMTYKYTVDHPVPSYILPACLKVVSAGEREFTEQLLCRTT